MCFRCRRSRFKVSEEQVIERVHYLSLTAKRPLVAKISNATLITRYRVATIRLTQDAKLAPKLVVDDGIAKSTARVEDTISVKKNGAMMEIARVFSFLTYPGKNRDDVANVSGTEIPIVEGKLCRMLDGIYRDAETECDIPITFTSEDGLQENPVRTEIMRIVSSRRMDAAEALANRLQRATGGQSGMALFFVCLGKPDEQKIVIARFPADEGIVAEKAQGALTVSFVEQVFLKSAHAYKAVIYKGGDGEDNFWGGHAIDRQINSGAKTVADYWIVDFLKSDFRSTSAQGTKRLALALRSALSSTANAQVRHEIAMAAQLAQNVNPRRVMTTPEFCDHLNLSEASKAAVISAVNPARTLQSRFRFDRGEFSRLIAYKSVELDNGAILSAQVSQFEECFEATVSDNNPEIVTYSTSGTIVDQRLRSSK